MDRRTFGYLLAGAVASPLSACATRISRIDDTRAADRSSDAGRVVLYSSVGEVLTHYDVEVAEATLLRRDSVALPANVQYAWRHPSRRHIYVTSSNGGPGSPGDQHHVSVFRILADGSLQRAGAPRALRWRPIHNSVDPSGRFLLIAYNSPSGASVHRLGEDGSIGEEIVPAAPLDAGIYAHQIIVTPSGRNAILVTRGNDAAGGKAEDPGALKWLRFTDGTLGSRASIAPGNSYGFGPRHLDFHPQHPLIYVSIERQNKLHAYRLEADGLSAMPLFVRDTLAEPDNERPRQLAGAIHVHPNGRFVYVSNRADGTVEFEGRRVFRGGENSIAVFALDPVTGEPTLIQHAPTRGIHVRTFSLDPSGRLLVAASIIPLAVRDGQRVETLSAGLSVFGVGADGTLEYKRKYDIETGGKTHWWAGMVGLPA